MNKIWLSLPFNLSKDFCTESLDKFESFFVKFVK